MPSRRIRSTASPVYTDERPWPRLGELLYLLRSLPRVRMTIIVCKRDLLAAIIEEACERLSGGKPECIGRTLRESTGAQTLPRQYYRQTPADHAGSPAALARADSSGAFLGMRLYSSDSQA